MRNNSSNCWSPIQIQQLTGHGMYFLKMPHEGLIKFIFIWVLRDILQTFLCAFRKLWSYSCYCRGLTKREGSSVITIITMFFRRWPKRTSCQFQYSLNEKEQLDAFKRIFSQFLTTLRAPILTGAYTECYTILNIYSLFIIKY